MNFQVYNNGQINVIFLHGWGADNNSFIWLKGILKNCNTHFANLDGFGGEPAPDDPSILGYANRLNDYITNNGLDNVVLVGHSFGGRVAIEYASKYKILGLVLVDSAGIKPKFNLRKYINIKKYKITKWLVKNGIVNKTKLDRFGSHDYKNCDGKLRSVFLNAINYDQSSLLKSIKVPTLIVWGDKDKDTPLYMAKKLNKKISGSGLVILKNCSHFSFLEDRYTFAKVLQIYTDSLLKGEK